LKVYLAKYEPDRTGGGWSWQDNFYWGFSNVITSYEEADIFMISGASIVHRDEVRKAKEDGKKIVLRVDNAIRNSRNRNTGMTRMKDFADWADLVIYQSEWAKEYLEPFLKKDGPVILNGVDTELFKPGTPGDKVLYSRFNRDETKNFEVARYWYSQYQLENPDAQLLIVGQFSPELIDGNFDFYNNEQYRYLGVVDKTAMADIYKQCSKYLYTYYNDCCSNSLLEALCSGCEVVGDPYYLKTGGAKEIMNLFYHQDFEKARRFCSRERMCMEYKGELENVIL
jgi:glycosyltransferase involved in cell wall biosynthesis